MAKRLPPKSAIRRAPARRPVGMPSEQLQPGLVGATAPENYDGPPPAAATSPQTTLVTTESDEERAQGDLFTERDTFLTLMRQRFRMSVDSESQLRQDMLDDLRFYNSDQWPIQTKMERTLDGRPTLTINRLPQFVRQVINQARQSKPAIQINPVDNGADPDTAEVIQGLVRNIERQSRAHIAYSTANEHQAIMGRGWWRILAEYAADDSMEQEIRIKRVMDAFTVYPDPSCGEPDYSDANFCFVVEHLPKHEYQLKYGVEAAANAYEFQGIGDQAPDWCYNDGVRVAEYFYVESTKATIADVMVGDKRMTVDRTAVKPEDQQAGPDGLPLILILKERETQRRQVKWALVNGCQILDGNAKTDVALNTKGRDLPGRYIPVVPVLGEELVVDGRKNLRGMIRDAKDPQRAYNFWVSAETEMIALAPRTPVIGAVGQFEGLEAKWNQANRRNFAYLEYNPMDVNGHLVPPPARPGYDPNIGPIVEATMQADRDLKSVIGMFDASQEGSPEQSGKAIIARQKQGEEGTSHFLDNLSRSIEHTGRILLDWIPVYYDKPRMLRITGLDEQPKDVIVHAGNTQGADAMQQKSAQDPKVATILDGHVFDVGVGRYDVTISVGPSYQSRRQESVEALIQLVQAYPAMLPVVGDILVGNMDWPGARQLAERLKRMVPAEAKDPQEGQEPIPAEVQQQLQQLEQQLNGALEALHEKDQIIQTKQQELTAKAQIEAMTAQSKERLEAMRYQHEVLMAQVTLKNEMAMAMLEARLAELTALMQAGRDEVSAHVDHTRSEVVAEKQFGRQQATDARTHAHQTQLAKLKTAGKPKPKPGARA